jgi:SAM-dependent methyltransferase
MLHGLARAVSESFALPGPILEIGSYLVEGQEHIANLRTLFPGRSYIGIDMRPGPGVDRVCEVESLPFADASVGTVLALSTFEHVRHFWKGFAEVARVLRPDGALLVACPFHFHIHSYPSDYWRFTPEALKLLLAEYPSKIIGWHGPAKRPANVWALACREDHPPITPAQYAHYLALMSKYAVLPLRWQKRWRYRLGSWLFGARPFAPFLQRECWHTELLTRQAA